MGPAPLTKLIALTGQTDTEANRRFLADALNQQNGNLYRTAVQLNVHSSTLVKWMLILGLTVQRRGKVQG